MKSNTILVNRPESLSNLAALISNLGANDFISLDTEFNRVTTFYPRLDLIQVCIEDNAYLIDVFSLDLKPFLKALASFKGSLLVFSGSEDLCILNREGQKLGLEKTLCQNIIDIQLLMAFLNLGYSVGLQSTLLKYLDISLPKDQTLSDWSVRPLTDEQTEYAANDVLYLQALYKKLISFANPNDKRLEWFKLEMSNFVSSVTAPADPQTLYIQVSGAGTLSKRELTILKVLCLRRYELAAASDDALNRIITSKALIQICRLSFVNAKTLASCGMKWGAIKENCQNVIKWVEEGRSKKVDENMPLPYDYFTCRDKSISDFAKKLKHDLSDRAKKANIAPELIASKALIHDFIYSAFYKKEPLLYGSWYSNLSMNISVPELVSEKLEKMR